MFVPIFGALLYFFEFQNSYLIDEKRTALLQIVLVTIILPLLVFFVLRATGLVSSIMVATISERKIPLIIQCFLMVFLVQKCITITSFPILHFFFLGGLLSAILALIGLFFNSKASLHMIGICALTTFVMGLFLQKEQYLWSIFFVITSVFVALSRLYLKAHNSKEINAGLLIGVLPQVFLMPFWL